MHFGREATLSKRKRDLSEKYDHYANILDLAKHFSVSAFYLFAISSVQAFLFVNHEQNAHHNSLLA